MDKSIVFQADNRVTHGRGYVYSIQYHIVWCTKYRKPVMTGVIADDVRRHLAVTAADLNADIVAMEVMPDHVHLLLDCKPQFRPSDAVKVLKGNTARWLFMAHPELKSSLWGGHMWNPSYFVATVSDRSLSQVEAYINSQQVIE